MDIKVIKGNVVYDGVRYGTDEVISGVDQDTADYLLFLKVGEVTPEKNQIPVPEPVPAAQPTPRKSKKETGPKTSL